MFKMETNEQDQDKIRNLFNKSSDLKLPANVRFVFGTENSDQQELTGKQVIDLVIDNKFTKLFYETNETLIDTKSERIFVPKIESKAFINLLRYVYFGKMIKNLSDLSSTYLAAKYYSIPDLCEKLLQLTDEKLSIDTSTIIYDQYLKLGDFAVSKLNEVISIINIHAFLAIQSNEFVNISKDTLIKLLEKDQLFVQEKDLYYAVLKWINNELRRQNLDANLANGLKEFNEFKHLIRFPIMSYNQFFTAFEVNKEMCPAKSGLFTDEELNEFELYFNQSRDPKVLSINYNVHERAKMNIGFLRLIKDKNGNLEFEMSTSIDELYCKQEIRTDELNSYLDVEPNVQYDGDNYEFVLDENLRKIRSKKVPLRARRSNAICSYEAIRVFKIIVACTSNAWNKGERMQISENGKLISAYYKRYRIDKKCGFYDYWPSFELKKGYFYDFNFLCPNENGSTNKFRLDNIYSKTENGDLILDVKLKILNDIGLAHPVMIYFMYK